MAPAMTADTVLCRPHHCRLPHWPRPLRRTCACDILGTIYGV